MGVDAVDARRAGAFGATNDLAGDGLDRLGGEVAVAELASLATSALTFGQVGAWVIDSLIVRPDTPSSGFKPRALAVCEL